MKMKKAKATVKGKGKETITSSWVSLFPGNPLVHKLHHWSEYQVYNLERDPYELQNEINNPEYRAVADELKNERHAKLAERGDADPIATEKFLVKSLKGKKRTRNPLIRFITVANSHQWR